MPWQEGIVESGKVLSKSHSANSRKGFQKFFSQMKKKHFVLSPNEEQELPRSKEDLG